MCQQSLINYLDTAVNIHKKSITTKPAVQKKIFGPQSPVQQTLTSDLYKPIIPKKDIEKLIHTGEQFGENEAMVLRKGGETKTYSHQLPESIRKNAKLIDEKLAYITVCDPAVGSGAFPVAMMSEIVKARNVLSVFLNDKNRKTYDFKRQCIEHSLYGVDIDPGAVEIAKLRLWLSLVVDEQDIKNIKPLPNLDYKVVCGNSLLGYPYRPRGLNKIEILKERFLNETRPKDKIKLHEEIDEAIYGLYENTKKSLGYQVSMDFNINFSEVFHRKGGFDIVIANPPYVTIALGKKQKFFSVDEVASLKQIFKDVYEFKGNTFSLFFAMSIALLNGKGVLTFITPNTLLLNATLQKTRKYILNNCNIQNLISITGGVFESGETGGDLISILSKGNDYENIVKTSEIKDTSAFNYKLKFNYIEKYLYNEIEGNKFYLDIYSLKLMKEIAKDTLHLGDIVKFYQGIITGDNNRFLSDKKISNKHYKILRGRDIHKYFYNFGSTYVLFDKKLLWSNTNEELFHVEEKLINRQTSSDLIAAYDNMKIFTLDSTHIQILKNKCFNLKYILALFNSKLLNFYYHQLIREEGRVFAQVKTIVLKTLPIKDIPIEQQQPFVSIVDRILTITEHNDSLKNFQKQAKVNFLEAEIDQLVYKLYDLTPEEIKIVEGKNENAD